MHNVDWDAQVVLTFNSLWFTTTFSEPWRTLSTIWRMHGLVWCLGDNDTELCITNILILFFCIPTQLFI